MLDVLICLICRICWICLMGLIIVVGWVVSARSPFLSSYFLTCAEP